MYLARALVLGFVFSLSALTLQAQSTALSPAVTEVAGPPTVNRAHLPVLGSRPASPPERDPAALSEVQASLAALGGLASIQQVQTCALNLQIDGSPGNHSSGPLILTISGSEFRSDFQGPSGTVTISTGNGKPFRLANGKSAQSPSYVTRAWFWPTLVASELARELEDPHYAFTSASNTTIGSESVVVVETVSQATDLDAIVTPQKWYFDPATNLPLRVEYRLPDTLHPDRFQTGAVDLSKYQAVGSVVYPFVSTVSISGREDEVQSVTSIQQNISIPSSEFSTGAPQ